MSDHVDLFERISLHFSRHLDAHHEGLRSHMDHQFRKLEQRIDAMSGSLDDQLASLTALAQKQSDDDVKFRADVTAALAAIQTGGTLTAAQQAAIDNLRNIMTTSDDATVAADAALPGPRPTP